MQAREEYMDLFQLKNREKVTIFLIYFFVVNAFVLLRIVGYYDPLSV